MKINSLIKNKLLQYLSNETSKEELYRWAIDMLHNMLKGAVCEITYLEVWGIITELTTIDDMDDFSCGELVRRLECYNGKRCFYVHVIFNNGVGSISIQA